MTIPAAPDALLGARLHAGARQLLQNRRPGEALPMLDRLARLPGLAAAAALMRAEALATLERLRRPRRRPTRPSPQIPDGPLRGGLVPVSGLPGAR